MVKRPPSTPPKQARSARLPAVPGAEYLRFRCTGCGNCCRGTYVFVSAADVTRIAEGTGLPARAFLRWVKGSEARLERDSPLWVRFDDGGREALALRWQRGRKCMFLDGEERCSIYEHRPVTCREHPFEVETGDRGEVRSIGLSRIVECPHEWDGTFTLRDLGAMARWNLRQCDAYHERIKAWNRRRSGRTRPGFLRYLGFLSDGAARCVSAARPRVDHSARERNARPPSEPTAVLVTGNPCASPDVCSR